MPDITVDASSLVVDQPANPFAEGAVKAFPSASVIAELEIPPPGM